MLAVAAAGMQTAKAGDRDWAAVGKILSGFVVVDAIHHAIAEAPRCAPVYYPEPAPCQSYGYGYNYCPPPAPRVVYAPPACYAPAPVVVCRSPVYYAPAPVVRFGFGDERRHSHHDRW